MTVTFQDLLLIQAFLGEVFEGLPEDDLAGRLAVLRTRAIVISMLENHTDGLEQQDNAGMN